MEHIKRKHVCICTYNTLKQTTAWAAAAEFRSSRELHEKAPNSHIDRYWQSVTKDFWSPTCSCISSGHTAFPPLSSVHKYVMIRVNTRSQQTEQRHWSVLHTANKFYNDD